VFGEREESSMSRAPLPEARGSHVAAVIEINRAVAYSAKAASKERRRAKKVARAKRKIAEKARENMSNNTSDMVALRGTTLGTPLPGDVRDTIRRALKERGRVAVFNLIHHINPNRTRGSVVSAMLQIRDDTPAGAEYRFARSWQSDFRKAAQAIMSNQIPPAPKDEDAIRWPSPASRREIVSEKSSAATGAPSLSDKTAFQLMIRGILSEELRNLLSAPAEPAADAKTPTDAERIDFVIREASRIDRKYRARWSKLYAEFELEENYDFGAKAKEHGIEAGNGDPGWRLEVAVADGASGRLLALAQKLWPVKG